MPKPVLYPVYVSFNPDTKVIDVWKKANGTDSADPLDVDKGKAKIKWQPIDGQQDQWRFTGLGGLPTPPFSGRKVEPQEIEIEDDNEGGDQPDYHYQIEIVANGATFSPDPRIRNKPN